jgi:NADH dehydrogenase [ubiquinone] 1 alpha subcomplex assembly factor 6
VEFRRNAIERTFDRNPPDDPISILLAEALEQLKTKTSRRSENARSSLKFWISRLMKTRAENIDNRPFRSLSALEDYAENTYSTLMYAIIAAIPMQSLQVDHLASHIGKACGIIAVIRGVPVLARGAAPARASSGLNMGGSQEPVVLLPLDIMAQVGLKEEDLFRLGPNAPGLQDAIFAVATRANDHLITAREMLKNIKAGSGAGHDYEHQMDDGHQYTESSASEDVFDVRRSFGVLLEAIAAQDFLDNLQRKNFDPFAIGGASKWKLPWKIWRALDKHEL